jgi:hypothetical protein
MLPRSVTSLTEADFVHSNGFSSALISAGDGVEVGHPDAAIGHDGLIR